MWAALPPTTAQHPTLTTNSPWTVVGSVIRTREKIRRKTVGDIMSMKMQ
jgi:hypothetical protein